MTNGDTTESDTLVDLVQQAYPAIWFACHVEHRTRHEPHPSGLTDREATVLAHVPVEGIDPRTLAEHLGMAKSSLSAHLARLEALRYVEARGVPEDGRRKVLILTRLGRDVRRASSPLSTQRVEALLAHLPPEARQAAVAGLCALADAARKLGAPAGGGVHATEPPSERSDRP